jgi:outer membrane protein OmpA-like peptidoglycan-associated protein
MYTISAITNARVGRGALLVAALITASGCASLSNKEKGAAIGAVAGAGVGAVIGNQTGSTARGAIIGAVLGGVAGTVIGNQMDQQAKELRQEIPGATVTRVGEGIAVTFASGLLYDVDSDRIRADAATNLRSLSSSLGKYPNTDLLIVGHTDGTGTSEYNQGLSQRRALSASDYLVTQGVAAARLRTSGRGELEPIATNETESGRLLNRRVEIAIFANAAAKKAAGY